MEIAVVTLFPELLAPFVRLGVTGRGITRGLVSVSAIDPRVYASDPHGTVDDRPYGGGPGMVLKVEPFAQAIRQARNVVAAGSPVVFLTPQGRCFDQAAARGLAKLPGLVLVAGRYEGFDERLVASEADDEISLGDFVMSGGEIAAMAIIDSVARLLPGVLGDDQSAVEDSFTAGLLDHPHYTRPEVVAGLAVPRVLLAGDHEEIRRWRRKQSLGRTGERRPDLLAGRQLSAEDRKLLDEYRSDSGSGVRDGRGALRH